jgi:Protein of unknown function (DUF1579)
MKMWKSAIGLCVAAAFLGTPAMAQPGAKPTVEHKILAGDEGTWDATIKSYMGGPDAEPAVSKGTEVNTVMTGGLWVLSKFEGDFGGMKFEGHGQFGYDPIKKKYVGTWIDSLSPNLSVLEGTYDPKTKTMTYVGEGIAPEGVKYTQKMVTTTKDDGSRVFTLYMKVGEAKDEAKFMEITYRKRK